MRVVAGAALAAVVAAGVLPACSQGEGNGSVTGTLDIPDCWSGDFNLHPSFFAAVSNTNSIGVQATTAVQIRIQNGSDYEGFSDGLLITVDDAGEVRSGLLGTPLVVSEPPSAPPPGVPVIPVANPPLVQASLYLNHTCATSNDALFALSAVTLGPNGECANAAIVCGGPAIADGGTPEASAAATDASSTGIDAGGPSSTNGNQTGQSTITFNSLFDGNEDEPNAAARLSDATFEFFLADPREGCPGGLGPPPPCRGHLVGNFHFYFQRGSPGQPFP